MSDSKKLNLNIKQEPVLFDNQSVTGKAIDFQYTVKPKQEHFGIKAENESDLEGEIIEYEEYCGLGNSSPLISEINRTHICVECNDSFPYKNHHVHEHFKRIISQQINEENPYHCKECNITFNASNNALNHLFLHDKKKFNCIHCNYIGEKLTELNNHLKVLHSEYDNTSKSKILFCKQCSFKTTYYVSLNEHISSKHAQAQYMCKICKRYWPDKNHVLHEKVINIIRNQLSEENPYKCAVCKIKLFKSDDICNHLKVHDIAYYYCTHCAFHTKSYSNFLKHEENEHLDQIDTTEYVNDSKICCNKCQLMWPDGNHHAHVGMLKLEETGVSEENPYTCLACKIIITDIKRAYYHLSKRCIKIHCMKCTFATLDKSTMYRHMLKIHRNPNEAIDYKYFCNLCDYKTLELSNFKAHQNVHKKESEKTYYNCDECHFKASAKHNMKIHKLKVHSDKIITCDQCGYITKNIQYFEKHFRRKHNQSDIYNCDQCSYWTHDLCYLRRHKNIHGNQGKYYASKTCICDKCGKVYKSEPPLRKHLYNIHNAVRGTLYICYHCNYKNIDRPTFTKHVSKHSKHKINVTYMYCANCDYKTKTKTNLVQHMVKHTDPSKLKMYKCSICSFETKRPHTLRGHMQTH